MGQTYPDPMPSDVPAYVATIVYRSGTPHNVALGNEGTATSTDVNQYPLVQTNKLNTYGVDEAIDVTKPLGSIGPLDVYPAGASEPTPTISTLAPDTGVGGAAAVEVTVTGTNFTPFSVVKVAGYPVATVFVSATSLKFIMRLPTMVAGATTVAVKTGSKQSTNSTFTVT
jgi:hypothetical protein